MSKHSKIFALVILLVIGASVAVVKLPTKQGLDLAGGVRVTLQAETDKLPDDEKWSDEHMDSIIRIIRSRVDIQGVSEPLIQRKGDNQVVVELPDIHDKDAAIEQLRSTARLEFRHFHNVHHRGATRYRPAAAKYTMDISTDEKGDPIYEFIDSEGNTVPQEQVIAESRLILTGDDIKPVSRATKDPSTFGTVVALEFKRDGRQAFADFTRRNVDEILAIILDDKILSAPTINTPILDGNAIITGRFSPEEAQRLAEFINAGALPVPLTIIQTQSVEATLGKDSVEKSISAGVWGLMVILVFMVLYYLLPGLIACITLLIYALLTFAIFKLIPVTLTLPGIAAYILSIGMAVDANILIFERLKEELRTGKTLRAAIDAAFKRALTSIVDANISTLIICMILFYYGSGPIQGFALVLGIGILVSFFTAITVTRSILHMVVNTGIARNSTLFGVGRQWVGGGQEGRKIDLVRHASKYFALSAIVIIFGVFMMINGGLKPGIDFTGGSLTYVKFDQPVQGTGGTGLTVSDIDKALVESGFEGSLIQRSTEDQQMVFVRTKEISAENYNVVKDSIESIGGDIQSSEMIGGAISKELTQDAIMAIIISIIALVIYLSIRFAIGGLAYGFRFGICMALALIHNLVIVVGAFAAFGYLFGWEISALFVTAILTVIGYSVNDTIVIFDRIRENMRHREKGETFDNMVNKSILQSFARSINTSLTVIFPLVTLMVLGAPIIKPFIAAMLVGVIAGTYSSLFYASPLLAMWQRLTDKKPLTAVSDGGGYQMTAADVGQAEDDQSEKKDSISDYSPKSTKDGGSKKRNKRRF